MKFILPTVFAVTIALCCTTFARGEVNAGQIDGKVFAGVMGSKGEKTGDPDNFEFNNGMFHSTACDQYGYTSAPYSAAQKSGQTTFTSTTKNDAGDVIQWHGALKGDTISGTAVRTSGEKKYEMWFHGKAKQ